MRRRLVVIAVCCAASLGIAAPWVGAHGVLEGAAPPANTSLVTPPKAVVLSFSEAVDPAFTSVVVLDGSGRRVSGSSSVSPDGRRVTAPLPPLLRGVYTVRWRVLSAVDGHATNGFYAFAVGVAAPGGQSATGESPPPLQVVVRWISYAAALLLAGVAFFAYFIVRPALTAAEPHLAVSVAEIAASAVRRLSLASAVILIPNLALGVVLQAIQLFDVPLGAVLAGGQLRSMLAGTRLGWSVLLQAAMAAVLLIPPTRRGRVFRMAAVIWAGVAGGLALIVSTPGVGATTSQHFLHFAALLLIGTVYGLISVMAAIILPLVPDLRLPQARWAAPVAGAVILVGITLNAHAAGGGWLAVGADWIHLAAAATWIGGLAALIVTIRMAGPGLRVGTAQTLVPRFSAFAGYSLLALIITGSYSAWLNIPAWSGFVVTPYGRTLLVKLLLVLPWVALGTFNHFVMRPRLARGGDPSLVRRFVRLIGGEVALAGAVLLTVAALTITPPARVTMPVAAGSGLRLAGITGDMHIQLTVSPARAGWNTYEADVTRAGSRVPLDGRVQVRFTKLDEEVAPATLDLVPGRGAYRGEGAELGLGGWWRLDVIVRLRGQLDRTVTFPLYLEGGAGAPSGPPAAQLLADAAARARRIGAWRETEQITDGRGGVVVTRYAYLAPDRVQYATSSGTQAIVIGTARYLRDRGPWTMDTLGQPIALAGPYSEYLQDPEHPVNGRQGTCGNEPCRVVLWESPSASARFAAWIGERTHLIYRLLMVAPQHYMTLEAYDFDAPIGIMPPK